MSVPAAYLGVILIWSTTPLAIQWSAQGASFSFAVMARMLIGLAICLLLMRATRTAFPFSAAARQLYAISGLSLFGAMLLTYWGALHIPSGLISVIFGLTPLVTGVFAALWLSERTLTPIRIAGLGLALAGLWLIFGQPWPGDGQATLGTLAVVIGMSVQALGLVWSQAVEPARLRARHHHRFARRGRALLRAGPTGWRPSPRATARHHAARRRCHRLSRRAGLSGGLHLYYFVIKHLDAGRTDHPGHSCLRAAAGADAQRRIHSGPRLGRHRTDRRGPLTLRMAGLAATGRTPGRRRRLKSRGPALRHCTLEPGRREHLN
jgi:hypothetical protein